MAFNVKAGSATKQLEDDQGHLQNQSLDADDDDVVSAPSIEGSATVGSDPVSGVSDEVTSTQVPAGQDVSDAVQDKEDLSSVAAALRRFGSNADPSEVLSDEEVVASEPVKTLSDPQSESDQLVKPASEGVTGVDGEPGEKSGKNQDKPSIDTVPVTTTYGKMDQSRAAPTGSGGGGFLSGIASGISRGVGNTFRFVGGQRLADQINSRTDPAALARSIWTKRWGSFNKTVKQMDALAERRSSEVSAFNNAVTRSPAGKKIAQYARENNKSLNEVFGHLESGGQAPADVLASFEMLRSDANVKKIANRLDASAKSMMTLGDRSIKQLTELHTAFPDQTGADFQLNRIDTATKLFNEEKPLELTALGPKNSEDGRVEPPANTKEMREKLQEFMEKIREAISNLIEQLISKLRMK